MSLFPWWKRAALGLPGQMFVADFTSLSPGPASTLFGLLHTRGSGATVQTGTSTLYSALGTDVAGIGRALDADPAGIVIDESRTSQALNSRTLAGLMATGSGDTYTGSFGTGPDGAGTPTRVQVTSGGNSKGIYAANSPPSGLYTASHWILPNGTDSQSIIWGSVNALITLAGSGWQRVVHAANTAVGYAYCIPVDGADRSAFGGQTARARDAVVDCTQIESGSYATEFILTTAAAATRSGARLWHPSAPALIDGGRLSLRMVMQAKGANSDYSTDPYLWRIDASNYATIAAATGIVTTTVGGSAHSTALGVTWAQGDVLDIRIETGGSKNGVCRIGKNGGALTSIDSAPAAQGALSGSVVDLLQDGSAANVFSARLRSVEAYRAGRMP